jgi:hypothetical protein
MSLKPIRDLDAIPQLCAAIARRGRIGPGDVDILRETCPRGLRLTIGEAEAVFALARWPAPACAEWSAYFADVMGCWIVETFAHDRAPTEAARLLIAWLGGDQARLDPARFKMLARVLENLPDCPEDLLAFARSCLVRAMARNAGAKASDAGAA